MTRSGGKTKDKENKNEPERTLLTCSTSPNQPPVFMCLYNLGPCWSNGYVEGLMLFAACSALRKEDSAGMSLRATNWPAIALYCEPKDGGQQSFSVETYVLNKRTKKSETKVRINANERTEGRSSHKNQTTK
jgi:hypothetical protein